MRICELKSSTDKTYLTIDYDEKNNWIYNDWHGYVSPENVKQGSLAVLDALKKYRTSLGLNNNTHLVGRWDNSVDWIEKEWVPRAAESGLQYYAHVVDQESFAAASSAAMQKRTKGFFQMRVFDNINKAKAWLKKCQTNQRG